MTRSYWSESDGYAEFSRLSADSAFSPFAPDLPSVPGNKRVLRFRTKRPGQPTLSLPPERPVQNPVGELPRIGQDRAAALVAFLRRELRACKTEAERESVREVMAVACKEMETHREE